MKKQCLVFLLVCFCTGIIRNSVAQTIHVGDTLPFWSVSYVDWPPLWGSPQRIVKGVCKSVGLHCYVFVEDAATLPQQSEIDTLVSHFDTHFFPDLTVKYGPVPDALDNDPRVFILVLNESNWGGYFDPGQQMPDTMVMSHWNRHSSQHELIFVASSAFGSANGIVAHEFGHLLHWLQDHSPEPPDHPTIYWEEAWVDEGFSTFAAMYLTENIYQHNVLDNAAYFASNPDKPLIYFSDYNQVKLFMLFMFEHFGGWNYISALISNQLNGINGVNSTLTQLGYTQRFDDAFEQFAVANYIDDTLYAGGKYAYSHYNFPSCHLSGTYAAFPTGTLSGTISAYGADYYSFNKAIPSPVFISFDGQVGKKFRVDFIKIDNATNTVKDVISQTPDNNNHISYFADSLGSAYTRLVMVLMCIDSTVHENLTASYTYAATPTSEGINELSKDDSISVFPNPTNESIKCKIDGKVDQLEIFNTQGKLMFFNNKYAVNEDINVKNYPKGTYFVVIKSGRKTFRSHFVKE